MLLCASLGRLVRRFPLVRWCLHVDDLSGTVTGEGAHEVAAEVAEVFNEVGRELAQGCGMEVAEHKTCVVATS